MLKILRADKDTYITDRVIKSNRVTHANVGSAATLDLFKLYGYTSSGSYPNVELSRLLIHFDLTPIETLISQGKIDVTNNSFKAYLKLSDVYGGQPTPRNFTIDVNPLSRSFDEGLGRDIVLYSDNDVCNFLTGSRIQGQWLLSGCGLGGGLPGNVDYVTASTDTSNVSFTSTQYFSTGEENLYVDVTNAISATLTNVIPDEGFRIALNSSHENDTKTYFVKRFGTRTSYNDIKRPALYISFDDSIQDDTQNLTFDSPCTLFLNNYSQGSKTNLLSSSIELTGSNCVQLKLTTEISGGWYTLSFSGSQYSVGQNLQTGIYSATFTIDSSNTVLNEKLKNSGSVLFTPIWGTLDEKITYLSGTNVYVYPPTRTSEIQDKNFVVTIQGVQDEILSTEEKLFRVHIFDATSPKIIASRLPKELPGLVIRNVYYQIRDCVTNDVIIPFDDINNSTRVSSDSKGMYFRLDASNLYANRTYVIDILIKTNSYRNVYSNVSPTFKVKT